jgi:YD repeat-containing protein
VKFDLSHRHIQAITTADGPVTGTITYRYEAQNLVHTTNAWKNPFRYQYDQLHNLTRIHYPDKTQEVLTYNQEKDWIVRIENRNKCLDLFNFTLQEKDANYSSTAEKRCAGKRITKTVYEFRHKGRADGSKYLDQVKVTQGKKIQRVSYQNNLGSLNESP